MKIYTLDTNIIAYLMKGMQDIDKKLAAVTKEGNNIIINPITYYEICRGLLVVNALKKLETFKEICEVFGVVEFKREILDKAAEIYNELKSKGELVEDADIFIAAICITNDFVLVTNNTKHFDRISGLNIENWASC